VFAEGTIMTIRASMLAISLALGPMLISLAAYAESPDVAGGVNDYPTAARAEYVFACMTSNGQTQEALNRCSCAIDTIAAAVPYDAYVKAETILRMRHEGGGYLAQEFRVTASNIMLQQLQEAQAEADVSCF
jgi:hypothetical protein